MVKKSYESFVIVDDVGEEYDVDCEQSDDGRRGKQFPEGGEVRAVLTPTQDGGKEKSLYKKEEQKLNCYYLLQLMRKSMKMAIEMVQMTSITFLQRIGILGSAHFIIVKLKLHPISSIGKVKLLEYPTNPEKPDTTINIFQPIVSSVKLPRHQIKSIPKMRVVISWYMKGAVNNRQNSQCLRYSGRTMSDSRAKVGILRKGGYGTTRVMQRTKLIDINSVVID